MACLNILPLQPSVFTHSTTRVTGQSASLVRAPKSFKAFKLSQKRNVPALTTCQQKAPQVNAFKAFQASRLAAKKTPPPTNCLEEITSAEQFDRILSEVDDSTLVVVDFYASWCRGCAALTPMLEKLANMKPDTKWLKIEAEANKELLKRLNVEAVPRIQCYRGQDGMLVEFVPSAKSPQKLKKNIDIVERDTEHGFMVNGGQVWSTPLKRSSVA